MLSNVTLVVAVVGLCCCRSHAAEQDPIAHWRLSTDAKETGPHQLATDNHGVKFNAVGRDGKSPAAVFDGVGSRLEVENPSVLRFGKDDFTIALWLRTDELLDEDPGDLITCYDAKRRVGFNLSLRTNTGVATSQANTRQLQFGIDAGSQPKWTDAGRPGNAVLAFALAVHDGQLYAGAGANGDELGHVYRYQNAGKWIDCGTPDKCNSIWALAPYRGKLYAASSKYNFAGSVLAASKNPNPGGGIFRYEGDQRWTEVGRLPNTEAIAGLAVYKDRLYASSLYKPAGFFRMESDGQWTALATPNGKRVECLGAFNGFLWAGSYDGGRVYRFDGEHWQDFGQIGKNTQTYSFAVHRGQLCVGTWPSGKVFRLKGENWEDMGRLGNEGEVMGMLVHNGALYGGTLPLAEVYRYDGDTAWTRTAQLDNTPDVKYRRAWTMAQYQGRLFCSTLPSGHIHALEAGPCVTYDRELPEGWRHVAAVKKGGVLKLFVDGLAVAESAPFDPGSYDLTHDAPLQIGAGAGGDFHGSIGDLRLYRRALDPQEIKVLAQ